MTAGPRTSASPGALPVVLLSASVDGPPSALVPRPGFAGAITKPFDAVRLAELVGSLLGD
ncbi:hypothetical protein [Raineyella fluvialis]|uniref:hypothetical protein n=1 Tax=Raineyella fluvialis TaxID=2662261 RepID=UPI00188F1654|nr:hypothetical protein [Raineyella fluvialis]